VASLVTVAVVLGAVAAAAWYVGGAQRPFVEVSMTANGGPDGGQIPGGLPTSQIKNVVLVLADDMDWKLWREVPRLAALQSEGTTFTNYVVSESLCCPSRSTIFRGQYVHNHHVVSNTIETDGGWPTFRNFGYPSDCLPVWLQNAGVQTGLIGKYLNQFPQTAAEET